MIVTVLAKITGNGLVQLLLEKNVYISEYFMGIGAGSSVATSGEKKIFEILKNRCQPPLVVFDVGANKGQFLDLLLESIPTEQLQVHCFEPGAETFKILEKRNVSMGNVFFNNVGLGKEKGLLKLHYNKEGSGLASLTRRNLDHIGINFDKSETVNIETIEEYCASHNIDRINLLKIDVEGHELDVLAGAKKLFDQGNIDLVTFEFGGCNIDTRTFFRDFWYFFSGVDMRMYRITPSGYLRNIYSYREIEERFRTSNFLVTKSD